MHAIHPGAPKATRTGRQWQAPIEASLAILELTATEQPEQLEFLTHVLCNSSMSFAVQKLAADFDVSLEQLDDTIAKACKGLDRLEKRRGRPCDPAKLLDSPNLAALHYLCKARLNRVAKPPARRHRLERIRRKIERCHQVAQTRAWIDDFLGQLPAARKEARNADR